jgi:formylmethanofuran dehydrogenase subunit A
MTLEPATIFGLTDRGRLQEGLAADLVVFDPDTVSGPADYNRLDEPHGIDYVLVNGTVVASYGKVRDKFPGRVIRKRNESPLNIVEAPPAVAESQDPKAYSPPSKNRDAVSEGKKHLKAVHPARKAPKHGTH